MKTITFNLLVVLLTGLLSSTASAQVGGVRGGIGVSVGPDGPRLSGFGKVDLQKTIEFWVESNNKKILPQMDLQVDQIIELCQLTEEEAKRIRFAVKGVVSKRTAAASRQIEEFSHKSGLIDAPSDTVQESEFPVHDEMIFYSASPMGDGVVALGADFKMALTEHPLWIHTLEKTLTPAQFETYRQYRIENSRKLLHIAIDSWVASLDSEIFLSPQQLDAVTDFVRRELKEQITIEFPASMQQATETVNKAFARNADSLGDLLTDQQTELRRTLLFQPAGAKASWGPGPNR